MDDLTCYKCSVCKIWSCEGKHGFCNTWTCLDCIAKEYEEIDRLAKRGPNNYIDSDYYYKLAGPKYNPNAKAKPRFLKYKVEIEELEGDL
jgi:hypothetical protein